MLKGMMGVLFVVSKSLLTNQALIPDPNAFQYFAAESSADNASFIATITVTPGPAMEPVGTAREVSPGAMVHTTRRTRCPK